MTNNIQSKGITVQSGKGFYLVQSVPHVDRHKPQTQPFLRMKSLLDFSFKNPKQWHNRKKNTVFRKHSLHLTHVSCYIIILITVNITMYKKCCFIMEVKLHIFITVAGYVLCYCSGCVYSCWMGIAFFSTNTTSCNT